MPWRRSSRLSTAMRCVIHTKEYVLLLSASDVVCCRPDVAAMLPTQTQAISLCVVVLQRQKILRSQTNPEVSFLILVPLNS